MNSFANTQYLSENTQRLAEQLICNIPSEELLLKEHSSLIDEIEFETTSFERQRLRARLKDHYKACLDYDKEESYLAHGAENVYELSYILTSGELVHNSNTAHHGYLGNFSRNLLRGGYTDNGWGIFVIKEQVFMNIPKQDYDVFNVPLEMMTAILFPRQLVHLVRETFPIYQNKIKSYDDFL